MWTRLSQAESGVRTASLDSKPLGLWLLPPSRQPPCTLHYIAKRAQIDKKWHTICNQMLLICALQRRWTVLTCFDAGYWLLDAFEHFWMQLTDGVRCRSGAPDLAPGIIGTMGGVSLQRRTCDLHLKTWSLPSLNLPQKIRKSEITSPFSISPCLYHVFTMSLCDNYVVHSPRAASPESRTAQRPQVEAMIWWLSEFVAHSQIVI